MKNRCQVATVKRIAPEKLGTAHRIQAPVVTVPKVEDVDSIMVQKIREIADRSRVKSTVPKKVTPEAVGGELPENTTTSIKWPVDKQLLEVSRRLLQIKRLGRRYEAQGDYFNSGELAYQIQEIIRTTNELLQKTQRVNQRALAADQ